MSQNTRCPSCATLFKVVADQLRISDGWVRCGQCKQIFDATAHLQQAPESEQLLPDLEWQLGSGHVPPEAAGAETRVPVLDVPDSVVPAFLIAPPPAPPSIALIPAALIPAPLLSEPLVPEPLLPEPVVVPAPVGYELPSAPVSEADFEWLDEYEAPEPEPLLPAPPALPMSSVAPTPSPDDSTDAEEEFAAESLDAPDWVKNLVLPPDPQRIEPVLQEYVEGDVTADAPAEPEPEPEPEAPAEVDAETEADVETPAEVPPELPPSDSTLEPSFVRAARRQAFWRQLEVRASLVLLSLLLIVLLALQVAVHQRNYLAAAYPQWRPFLQTLCAPLQCKVAPYRHISSVVIDSSSFNKVQGDTYQFSIALKNTSGNVLEIPAIELTLTDAQEKTVLRRVFTRKDLSAPRTLAAHGDWSANLQVELALTGASIAGYRVLAFYP